ncbi:MAG: hypothetical protein IJ861_08050 [Clostridia bacterium]|nr:hypothetical protein [Clostridia bacterium]
MIATIMAGIIWVMLIIMVGGAIGLWYLFIYALWAFDILIKISAVTLPLFCGLHILIYSILRKKGFFHRFNDGWKKYAALVLRIYLIVAAVILFILFITALGYIFIFPTELPPLPDFS